MGLSTHVLDTMHGCPAVGMEVALWKTEAAAPSAPAQLLQRFTLNADGRPGSSLFDNNSLQVGSYRLVFAVGSYFKSKGVALPQPSFLDQVGLDFAVAHTDQHYHVPLLVSPWSYSTYRGS